MVRLTLRLLNSDLTQGYLERSVEEQVDIRGDARCQRDEHCVGELQKGEVHFEVPVLPHLSHHRVGSNRHVTMVGERSSYQSHGERCQKASISITTMVVR